MKLHLLLLSSSGFPPRLLNLFEKADLMMEQARGRLKIKELAQRLRFDAVIWLYGEEDHALTEDLAQSLNEFSPQPLVLITRDLAQPPLLENLPQQVALLDINDEPTDILRAVQGACSQSRIGTGQLPSQVNEIDFKNMMGQGPQEVSNKRGSGHALKLETPWAAVDASEKRLLAGQHPLKKSRFSFLGQLTKKEEG